MAYIIAASVILLITFFVWYVFSDKKNKNSSNIPIGEVNAGSKDSHIEEPVICAKNCHSETYNTDNKPLSDLNNSVLMFKDKFLSKNHIVMRVKGDCMTRYGIMDGEYVVIQLFDKNMKDNDKVNSIKRGDILYIVYQDEQDNEPTHKIRVYDGNFDKNEKTVNTLYFDKDSIKYSSNPHSFDKIKGVVRYTIPPQNL